MNIFILGFTKTGKTTVAEWLSKDIGGMVISGSSWIKEELNQSIPKDRERTEYLTEYTLRYLNIDHKYSAAALKRKSLGLDKIIIYEGIRNPNDFMELYNPNSDVVIFIERWNYPNWIDNNAKKIVPVNFFEQYGIRAIKSYLDFCFVINKSIQKRCIYVEWFTEGSCEDLSEVYTRYIYDKVKEIHHAGLH